MFHNYEPPDPLLLLALLIVSVIGIVIALRPPTGRR